MTSRFSVDEVRSLLGERGNIRNISVIAHVDHGKSTLTDSLLSKAGLISEAKAGEARALDTREDEQLRAITIKSTGVTLPFHIDDEDLRQVEVIQGPKARPRGNRFLVNLIDSPGHVDFSSEVTAALRVTDGALVIVDCVEGVCVQTETVLRQGLAEKVKPVLIINKVDRALLELKLSKEELYQRFVRVIEKVNEIIRTYQDASVGDWTVSPEKGNVAFTSGYQGWGFTLNIMAKRYAAKFGTNKDKFQEKLWGENYLNPKTMKWSKMRQDKDGTELERGFNQFVLEPIYQIFQAVMEERSTGHQIHPLLSKMSVVLAQEERELREKPLLKAVMKKFLAAGDALVELITIHLPSPLLAQGYRVENLYEGPLDDECGEGIRNCDPDGPLMVFISKMVPSEQGGRFVAFGRVFSGRVRSGQAVRIQGPKYTPGKKEDLFEQNIQRVVLMMGRHTENLDECGPGCIVGLVGVDQYLAKSGTITSSKVAWNLKCMKFSVSPVVQVAVAPLNGADLPKLIDGLKKLSKSDPLCQVFISDSGENVIGAAGELHLEICLKDLEEDYAAIPLKIGKPVVPYRETVCEESAMVCLSKSPNKLNRIYMKASPLGESLTQEIEGGRITSLQDPKIRARVLAEEHGWDSGIARKIWCFGPETTGPNLLVDETKGVQYLHQTKDSCVAAFQWATKEGVLCEEPMRGCKFSVMDVLLHGDAAHRGGGQIIPATRRAIYASFLSASPTLLEPIYLAEIQCPESVLGGIHQVLHKRRGVLFAEEHCDGTPLCIVKAHLPVRESFGFTEALRSATGGQAFPQLIFDHWELMSPELLKATNLVEQVRLRKGLSPLPPPLDYFADRL